MNWRKLERAVLVYFIALSLFQAFILNAQQAQIDRLFQLITGWRELYEQQKAKISE